MVLKELVLDNFDFGWCGGLEIKKLGDCKFGRVGQSWKGLILDNFTMGGCGGLEINNLGDCDFGWLGCLERTNMETLN